MRLPLLALSLALSVLGCDSKKRSTPESSQPANPAARAPLIDLTSASSLAAVRTAFNAHRGEPRFLTLLSPT
jgi:hypothetical protein